MRPPARARGSAAVKKTPTGDSGWGSRFPQPIPPRKRAWDRWSDSNVSALRRGPRFTIAHRRPQFPDDRVRRDASSRRRARGAAPAGHGDDGGEDDGAADQRRARRRLAEERARPQRAEDRLGLRQHGLADRRHRGAPRRNSVKPSPIRRKPAAKAPERLPSAGGAGSAGGEAHADRDQAETDAVADLAGREVAPRGARRINVTTAKLERRDEAAGDRRASCPPRSRRRR